MGNQQAAARKKRKVGSFVAAVVVAIGLIVGLRYATSDDTSSDPAAQAAKCTESDAVKLNVAASPEKSGIVAEIAQAYSGRTVAGHCVDVIVRGKQSGVVMQALARGWNEAVDGPRPDVWSPASTAWVNLLRQNLAATDRAAVIPDGDPESIANSPLTIAMPKPM